MRRKLYIATWCLNVTRTAVYLAWLIRCEETVLVFARDGLLGYLPVLPLAFVFLYLLKEAPP